MEKIRATHHEVLAASSLRWTCNEKELGISSTREVQTSGEILGQTRAMEALKHGLDMESDGYNIYVSGDPGTGRSTAVKALIERYAAVRPVPPDLCYVNNFKNPDMPRALRLPAGGGDKLKDEIQNLLSSFRTKLPLMIESDQFAERRRQVVETYKEQEKEIHGRLEKKIHEASFAVVQVQTGPYVKPDLVLLFEEKGVPLNQVDKLADDGKITHEQAQKHHEKYKELFALMEVTLKQTRSIERDIQLAVKRIAHELAEPMVHDQISDIKERLPHEEVHQYLDDIEAGILSSLGLFAKSEEGDESDGESGDPFLQYAVNVVVDNTALNGAPVVVETAPTYTNLFGLIEKRIESVGQISTNFTKIKPGSVLRANGGYLVLNAHDVLMEPGVWHTLKRTLRNRQIEVHTFEPTYGMLGTTALKPEPVKCDVKVIMVGDSQLYHLLYNMDNDFKNVFKIKAEFDTVMDRDEQGPEKYMTFLRNMIGASDLLHFDSSGIAAMLEFGVREAGRRNKLTTRFSLLADVAREASKVAGEEEEELVLRSHVAEALRRRARRVSLVDDKYQEIIIEGIKRIDTEGFAVGQINGLAVYQVGDYAFGKPTRITAQVGMGQSGIISIEREVKLSGRTHDKGVLILTGFLRSRFSSKWPMSVSATLCFEQSYSEIDGDSASSAEVYALLSALSSMPLRQEIAVTGAVDQMGNIQPIGGVNEKIEGFFRICNERGLTGTQGVIVPSGNTNDLMVAPEVHEAISAGKFRVWAVDHIDQGIEILTGKRAGALRKDGMFEKGTVNGLASERLEVLARGLKEFVKT